MNIVQRLKPTHRPFMKGPITEGEEQPSFLTTCTVLVPPYSTAAICISHNFSFRVLFRWNYLIQVRNELPIWYAATTCIRQEIGLRAIRKYEGAMRNQNEDDKWGLSTQESCSTKLYRKS